MLIGINGKLGSGKDAFFERARHLTRNTWSVMLPGRPERRAFADKLKLAFARLFDVDLDFLEKAKRDEFTLVQIREVRFRVSRVRGLRWTRHLPGFERIVSSQTVRSGLQRMGTEVGRNTFGDTFWIDQCVPENLDHTDKAVFVTDVRFPNEAERIRAAGGTVVRVRDYAAEARAAELRAELGAEASHDSEQVLDESLIHVEIDNSIRDDGFASLDRQVSEVLEHACVIEEALTWRIVQRPTRQVSAEVEGKFSE